MAPTWNPLGLNLFDGEEEQSYQNMNLAGNAWNDNTGNQLDLLRFNTMAANNTPWIYNNVFGISGQNPMLEMQRLALGKEALDLQRQGLNLQGQQLNLQGSWTAPENLWRGVGTIGGLALSGLSAFNALAGLNQAKKAFNFNRGVIQNNMTNNVRNTNSQLQNYWLAKAKAETGNQDAYANRANASYVKDLDGSTPGVV